MAGIQRLHGNHTLASHLNLFGFVLCCLASTRVPKSDKSDGEVYPRDAQIMTSGGMPCKTRTPSQGRKLERHSRLSEAQADGQEQARWLCRMAGRERRFRAGLVQPRKMG